MIESSTRMRFLVFLPQSSEGAGAAMGRNEVKSGDNPHPETSSTRFASPVFSLPVAWQPNITAPLPVIDQQCSRAGLPTIPCRQKGKQPLRLSSIARHTSLFDYRRKEAGQVTALWNPVLPVL